MIESAMKGKVPGAEETYALFRPKGESGIGDPEYAKKLQAFVQAAEKDDLSASTRFVLVGRHSFILIGMLFPMEPKFCFPLISMFIRIS